MGYKKSYAVLGLGIFGSTIATTLASYDYDVIAIDKDINCVERVVDEVASAVCADITDLEQLRSAGVKDVDCAIVATGSHLEDSIMAILNLKELNVSQIVAKAKNKKYTKILEKIGADRVISPEKEMGIRVAKQLISTKIVDLIDVDNNYSVVEISAYKSWANHTLAQLDLRSKYGINIIGIRKNPKAELLINFDPNYTIEENDLLIVIVDKEKFNKLDID